MGMGIGVGSLELGQGPEGNPVQGLAAPIYQAFRNGPEPFTAPDCLRS